MKNLQKRLCNLDDEANKIASDMLNTIHEIIKQNGGYIRFYHDDYVWPYVIHFPYSDCACVALMIDDEDDVVWFYSVPLDTDWSRLTDEEIKDSFKDKDGYHSSEWDALDWESCSPFEYNVWRICVSLSMYDFDKK